MDIEEIKNFAQNKIEADDLTKQVRRQIKETIWDKQNKREGFSETFKPLISQFEKHEDPKTKNIFTQNQEMLRNQLALTEGLRAHQRAITQGFNQFERLADMKELPGNVWEIDREPVIPEVKDGQKDEEPKIDYSLDLEKNFNENDLAILREANYTRPNDFYNSNIGDLKKDLEDVKSDIKTLTGEINGRRRKQNPSLDYIAKTNGKEAHKETLMKYKNIMNDYFTSLEYNVGQGLYFSPQELLHRFELLSGSLVAGNNGVLPEYIQIAHRLRDRGVITNNQLNTLLRKII